MFLTVSIFTRPESPWVGGCYEYIHTRYECEVLFYRLTSLTDDRVRFPSHAHLSVSSNALIGKRNQVMLVRPQAEKDKFTAFVIARVSHLTGRDQMGSDDTVDTIS